MYHNILISINLSGANIIRLSDVAQSMDQFVPRRKPIPPEVVHLYKETRVICQRKALCRFCFQKCRERLSGDEKFRAG